MPLVLFTLKSNTNHITKLEFFFERYTLYNVAMNLLCTLPKNNNKKEFNTVYFVMIVVFLFRYNNRYLDD